LTGPIRARPSPLAARAGPSIKLCFYHPVNGRKRSLREIARELEAKGFEHYHAAAGFFEVTESYLNETVEKIGRRISMVQTLQAHIASEM
jgi:hypothetical protein